MHLITFTTQWIFIVYFCAIEFVVVRSSWTSNEVNKEPKYYLQSGSVYTVPWEWLITKYCWLSCLWQDLPRFPILFSRADEFPSPKESFVSLIYMDSLIVMIMSIVYRTKVTTYQCCDFTKWRQLRRPKTAAIDWCRTMYTYEVVWQRVIYYWNYISIVCFDVTGTFVMLRGLGNCACAENLYPLTLTISKCRFWVRYIFTCTIWFFKTKIKDLAEIYTILYMCTYISLCI